MKAQGALPQFLKRASQKKGGFAAALPVCLPQRRQGKRGSFRPRQTDRASCEAFTLVGAFPRFVKAHEVPSRDYARLGFASEPLAHFNPERATRTQPGVSVALPPVI